MPRSAELVDEPMIDILAHEGEKKPQEECGLWAAWDPNGDTLVADAFIGAVGIEHRGEESAGIATITHDSPEIEYIRGKGRVREVFGENGEELKVLSDRVRGVSVHTRYGTDSGEGNGDQPRVKPYFALAHNGQITNGPELAKRHGIESYTTDSDLITEIIFKLAETMNGDVERATYQVLPHIQGAFCFTILTPDKLIAARDRYGVRPLHEGRTKSGGHIVASEVKAITDIEGATWVREIEPAEMVIFTDKEPRIGIWAEAEPAACLLEYFYLSNKENIINGHVVGDVRQKLGAMLWKLYSSMETRRAEEKQELYLASRGIKRFLLTVRKLAEKLIPEPEKIVVPIPNGGNQAAHGFAKASGLPLVKAFEKLPEWGRSFLQPTDAARKMVAKAKLFLHKKLVRGKHVVSVDDTAVRGNVSGANNEKLQDAGVARHTMLVASPPVIDTCQLGVDIGTKDELLAVRHNGDLAAMSKAQKVNEIIYLDLDPIVEMLGGKVCAICLGGPGPEIRTDIDEVIRDKHLAMAGQPS